MTSQEFTTFQTEVEGSAQSFENLPNGDALVTCADGEKILVRADGSSVQTYMGHCGGCGDEVPLAIAHWHGGVPYCQGCEDAPAEEN